jgi:flagellar hook-basal body complex protein FliE
MGMDAINGFSGLGNLRGIGQVGAPAAGGGLDPAGGAQASFADALTQLVGSVEGASGEANQAIGRMIDGSGDVHEAVIAMQKADTMLQLTVQIRNKLVQAYQDVMRMPV